MKPTRITPINPEITLNNGDIKKIRVFIKRPIMKKIIAMVFGLGRVVLWEGEVDFNTHKDDSEAQLITKLSSILNN